MGKKKEEKIILKIIRRYNEGILKLTLKVYSNGKVIGEYGADNPNKLMEKRLTSKRLRKLIGLLDTKFCKLRNHPYYYLPTRMGSLLYDITYYKPNGKTKAIAAYDSGDNLPKNLYLIIDAFNNLLKRTRT